MLRDALIAVQMGFFVLYALLWFERTDLLPVLYCLGKAIEYIAPYASAAVATMDLSALGPLSDMF